MPVKNHHFLSMGPYIQKQRIKLQEKLNVRQIELTQTCIFPRLQIVHFLIALANFHFH